MATVEEMRGPDVHAYSTDGHPETNHLQPLAGIGR
jgi:hypothetical protein